MIFQTSEKQNCLMRSVDHNDSFDHILGQKKETPHMKITNIAC